MRGVRRRGTVVAAGALLGTLLLSLLPWDTTSQDLARRFEGPSAEHLLGTDQLGRDLLARLVVGARLSLGLTAVLVVVVAVGGSALGVVAARLGGVVAGGVDRLVEVLVAVPTIIVGLALAAVLGPGVVALAAAVLVGGWTPYARVARNLTSGVLRSGWVTASVALGAGGGHVLRRSVLPHVVRPLLALACLRFADVLLALAGLSFLGLGVQPPTPEWGAMVADGRQHLFTAPRLLVAPAVAVVLATVCVGVLGRAVDRRLDVRALQADDPAPSPPARS